MSNRLYGHSHKQLRAAMMSVLKPGTPCRRCGQSMWPGQEPLDLGHPTDGFAGFAIEHRSCNRRAGAINANRSRSGMSSRRGQSPKSYRRRW